MHVADAHDAGASARARVVAAFAAIYLVWGSTYLFIRFAVESIPPFLMAGTRFLISGTILYAWARSHGSPNPRRTEWKAAVVSGTLMLFGGNGAVAWAEQRVPSGIAALLVAVVPAWIVLLDWWRPGGRRPAASVFAGLALGIVGLVLLVGPGTFTGHGRVDTLGMVVLMVGSICWASGSLYNRYGARPASAAMSTGMQMLGGGIVLVVAAAGAGEWARFRLADVTSRSALGYTYLVTVGSLVGFTAYVYLLRAATPAKTATYAYINPLVAVVLGWAFAAEPITPRTILAAAVILAGVAIITVRGAPPEALPAPAGERPDPADPFSPSPSLGEL